MANFNLDKQFDMPGFARALKKTSVTHVVLEHLKLNDDQAIYLLEHLKESKVAHLSLAKNILSTNAFRYAIQNFNLEYLDFSDNGLPSFSTEMYIGASQLKTLIVSHTNMNVDGLRQLWTILRGAH